ncbi:DUF456 domain-containing protein [Salegentibacter flavus]|uniref:DUF456 domain-containing protein n=1 Tax=Salegentibacter flavus TaxID=287099 RepID=A0A1I4XWF4_9FLAO|nr:DUF456 domain-containing protein [Salegentibacter flavus]SFN30117.1 hypothetical protein SAMN05660413_00409 [Salegentibacter flavus]
MDLLFVILGGILIITGILGSFFPVLPGIPISWLGLLMLYLAPSVPVNYLFLGVTLAIAILIYLLQLVIPAMGTKRYGGSKTGMWGATIGLVIGIFTPIPFGIIIGAFVGAFIGEIINKSDSRSAVRAAFGSFVGLLASTFMEFLVAVGFLFLFLYKVWEYSDLLF